MTASEEETRPAAKSRFRLRRRGVVMFLGLLALFFVLSASLGALAWQAMGKAATGKRLERMQLSQQWGGAGFVNPLPLHNDSWGMLVEAVAADAISVPEEPLPVERVNPELFSTPPASGLRVTWLGHSTTLIEIGKARFLTDPVWGERASPLTFIGPERWYAPPLPLSELPEVDAVLISHDHYDHLDHPTIVQLRERATRFVVPLGVGAHLAYWGVDEKKIVELDWWDRIEIGAVDVICTPARHASGRHVFDQNDTLWAGYALLGEERRAYFSGDTGMFPEFEDIGQKFGPFDVTMIEVGAYGQPWPDWHIGPEQAVRAHQMLRGKAFIPIHWGLFNLAMHGWTEPVERTLVAAQAQGVRALVPRPGESIEPETATTERWWPDVDWQTAEDYPIVSTGL